MKAYLIDPIEKEITEVEYNGDYKTIYAHIKAEMFEVVYLNEAQDCVFIDEEGLINGNPWGWFTLEGAHQPFRGRGLVVGTDRRGDSVAVKMSIEELRAMVGFPEEHELKDPEEYASIEVTGFDNPADFVKALFGDRIP